jgi:predicted NBD/HSP70 family sugar kinase
MTSTFDSTATLDPSPGGILNLVRSGASSSRAEIARMAGLAPSTVTARVEQLVAHGYLREAGPGSSRGGRRPTQLEVNPSTGAVVGVDLGARHGSFGLFDMAGELLVERHFDMDIAEGPERVLRWVAEVAATLVDEAAAPGQTLRGIGLGLPGPVDYPGRRMVSPSRMPGWNGLDAGARLAELSGVPAIAENDANLMALGEYAGAPDGVKHLVFLAAGSSIGCGVIASGALYRGFRGMAGDISHVSVPNAPATLCSCGRVGCLDVVAGGAAIVAGLRLAGVDAADTTAVLSLARDGHPLATQMLREAGTRTGGVLATIVNFFNPQRLVLGGNLSLSEAFVAGVRSAIYTECLPMATDYLEIVVSRTKGLAGISGAGRLVLDHLFDPAVINEALR